MRQFDIGIVAIKDPEKPVDAGPARAARLATFSVSEQYASLRKALGVAIATEG